MTDDGVQTRAHLEAQLASSLALGSPNEYRQCLLSYVRFLARYYICCLFCFYDSPNPIWAPCHSCTKRAQ
jgi:hypothetical protein